MPATVTKVNNSADVRIPLDGEIASAADLLASTVQPIVDQTFYNQERVAGLARYNGIRGISIENASFLNTVWGFSQTNPSFRKFIVQNDYGGTGYNVLIEITDVLPMSGKIHFISCDVVGAARDPQILPSAQYLPSIGLRRISRLSHPSTVGDLISAYEGQDASLSYAGYVSPHRILSPSMDISSSSLIEIGLYSYRYFIELRGELPNANAHNGLILYGARVGVTA